MQSTKQNPLPLGLREWGVTTFGGVFTDAEVERTLLQEANTSFQLQWPGYQFGVSAGAERDVVDQAFQLPANRDVTIEADTYDRWEAAVNFNATSANNPFGSIALGYEDGFFGGTQLRAEPTLGFAWSKYFRFNAAVFLARIAIPEFAPFTTTAANVQLSFTPNTVFLLDVTTQWNTETEQLALLSRIRRPGRWLD